MFCPIKATKVKKSHRSDVINNNGNNSSSNNNNNNNNNSNNNTNGNNHNNQSNNSEANNPSNNLTSENINTHINNTNNNNINGHNNNNNHHHHHHENANPIRNHHHVQYPTGNPYRYVIQDYAPKQADELEVYRGDRVFFDYEVDCSGKAWSYVFCMKRNRDGFVPSANLSTEPIRNQKIKMPHISSGDNISPNLIVDERAFQHQQHQLHHQHNSHLVRDKCAQRSRGFGVGARMYQDLSSLHAYGNLQHSNSFELKCTPFPTDNCGLYVVTHSFVAREENDLSVNSGEYIVVLNKEDEDWFWVRRECDQAEGFVPSRYICDLEQVKSILNKGNSTVTMKSSMNQNDFHTYINQPNDDDKLLRC